MTTQNTNQASVTLPEPQQAFDHLFSNVHAQAFFGKLAQLGYAPNNQKEANDLLDLAAKLRIAETQTKRASAGNNPFAAASANLDQVLAANGLDGGIKQASAQERDVAIRGVAARLMADPDIYNSVLSVKSAEADQVAKQLGLQPQQA